MENKDIQIINIFEIWGRGDVYNKISKLSNPILLRFGDLYGF